MSKMDKKTFFCEMSKIFFVFFQKLNYLCARNFARMVEW